MKAKVAKIINEWDPIDLLFFCPKDEYEDEINLISETIDENTSVEKLADKVNAIFIKMFGVGVFTKDINECIDVAKKILSNE
jgi:hypothetical protein